VAEPFFHQTKPILFPPLSLFYNQDVLPYTDKKEKKIFLIYKEIQMGAVIYEEGLPNI
jgi:hypothetical protein